MITQVQRDCENTTQKPCKFYMVEEADTLTEFQVIYDHTPSKKR